MHALQISPLIVKFVSVCALPACAVCTADRQARRQAKLAKELKTITKPRKKESAKLNFLFRVFVLSCFRDKNISCLDPACPG